MHAAGHGKPRPPPHRLAFFGLERRPFLFILWRVRNHIRFVQPPCGAVCWRSVAHPTAIPAGVEGLTLPAPADPALTLPLGNSVFLSLHSHLIFLHPPPAASTIVLGPWSLARGYFRIMGRQFLKFRNELLACADFTV